jgi:PBP1b-binding outer membrane lipoprotein LpoB
MNFLNSILVLVIGSVLFLTGCTDAAKPLKVEKVPDQPAPQAKGVDAHGHEDSAERISIEDAKKEFDAGTAAFLDTRDPRSFAMEHIAGAINIPETEIDQRLNTIPKGKKLIAYCS